MTYKPHIDGLRAIAVIAVIFYHLEWSLFNGGFIGVDIFLVISGYLITSILYKQYSDTGTIKVINFFQKRFRRLLPSLLITLTLSSITALFILSPTSLIKFAKSVKYALISLSNIHFWKEANYFDTSSKLKPLLHTWSLSIEEQFYLFWPFLILCLLKISRKHFKTMLFSIGFISFYLNIEVTQEILTPVSTYIKEFLSYKGRNINSGLFYLLPFRVFEFVLGALLINIDFKRIVKHNYLIEIFNITAFTALAYCTYTYTEQILFPSFNALIPCIATCIIIGTAEHSKLFSFLKSHPFTFTGKLSYSLYLFHWPMIVFTYYVIEEHSTFIDIVIIIATFILSYLNFKYVENYFRYKKVKEVKWSYLTAITLISCFIIIVPINNGFPFRKKLDSNIVNLPLLENSDEYHKSFYGGKKYSEFENSENANVSYYLLGDSHGKQYYYGFTKYCARNNCNVFTNAGTSCINLKYFSRSTNESNWDEHCKNAYKQAIVRINKEKPNYIIISHFWLFQLKHAKYKGTTTEDLHHIKQGIVTLLDEVPRDTKIIIIGNVPTTNNVNLYDKLTSPLLNINTRNLLKTKTEDLKEVIELNINFEKIVTNIKNVTYVNPFKILCNNIECHNLDTEKRLIYSDPNHLSLYGSELMVKEILKK
ncbi:acyltransferase family protein [Halobacteriovorax sp. XZX-3]|uniref:acyltransferase family protein n=1 Tax=unclassified Halobacteriovorax TaxID=2639665 RepID=UPI00372006B5